MDTGLMVLRKKQSQVTFLHVFHHASILNVWWWVESFLPGGQGQSLFPSRLDIAMYVCGR